MRLGKIAVSVALGALAVGAQAQTVRVPPVRTVATLGSATAPRLVIVTDGTSAADCSTGGGSTAALCMADGSAWVAVPLASSSGTVSSVALSVPAEWSVSGSPITTSGTITISEATQSANTVYAGPTTGGAAAPGFRSLVSADIPNNAANTSGNAGTATALAANGGNCSAGSYPLGVDAAGAVESCTAVTADPTLAGDVDGLSSANDIDEAAVESELESVLDLQDLQGAVTDFQVPNNITVSLAATATALAANGANCSAGQYPLGVDASGAAEGCTVAPGGPSSGAPSTSGTLALWLAADDSSLADSSINGKGVWLWHDRSGNGRHAYQLDANLRPTVTLASQNTLSGFTTPAGGYLLGGNGPGTVSAGSVYVVVKPGTVVANNRIFSLSSYAAPASDYNGGIAALLVDGGGATTVRAFRTSLANDLDIAGGTLGTSAALFVLRWGAGSAALRKNNDSEATDTYTDYSFRADLFSIMAGPTGAEATSGAAVIYEVLWYSTKLSDGDDTTVRTYINSKWALW